MLVSFPRLPSAGSFGRLLSGSHRVEELQFKVDYDSFPIVDRDDVAWLVFDLIKHGSISITDDESVFVQVLDSVIVEFSGRALAFHCEASH